MRRVSAYQRPGSIESTPTLGVLLPQDLHNALATLVLSVLPLLGQEPALPKANSEAVALPSDSSPEQISAVPRIVLDDTLFFLTAPSGWERKEWLQAGGALTAVVGTALLLDTQVRDESQRHRSAESDKVAKGVQLFGAGYAFGVIGGFWAYGKLAGDSEAVHTGLDAAEASLIAGAILGPLLKSAVGRSRPSRQEGAFHFKPFGGGVSFPSGHTTEAFTVATVISEHYPQFWVRSLAYGTAALVGISRIQQNAHFASDVLGGALLGTLVGRTVVLRNGERRGTPSKVKVSLTPDFGPGYQGAALSVRF